MLEFYVERLPASFLEEKECSIAWHYRQSDAESADFMAQELKFELIICCFRPTWKYWRAISSGSQGQKR